ncbi:hypothetical protein BT69DRAFT_1282079, partial [Atractiella rhizophila]
MPFHHPSSPASRISRRSVFTSKTPLPIYLPFLSARTPTLARGGHVLTRTQLKYLERTGRIVVNGQENPGPRRRVWTVHDTPRASCGDCWIQEGWTT